VHPAAPLEIVLGRERVLDAAADGRRRALAIHDGVVVGVGAFELLYGPRAEFAVSVRDAADRRLVLELIAALAGAAQAFDVLTLRAEIAVDQRALAHSVPGATLVGDALQIGRAAAAAAVRAVDVGLAPAPVQAERPVVRIMS
jgi:hypothetical protein